MISLAGIYIRWRLSKPEKLPRFAPIHEKFSGIGHSKGEFIANASDKRGIKLIRIAIYTTTSYAKRSHRE